MSADVRGLKGIGSILTSSLLGTVLMLRNVELQEAHIGPWMGRPGDSIHLEHHTQQSRCWHRQRSSSTSAPDTHRRLCWRRQEGFQKPGIRLQCDKFMEVRANVLTRGPSFPRQLSYQTPDPYFAKVIVLTANAPSSCSQKRYLGLFQSACV